MEHLAEGREHDSQRFATPNRLATYDYTPVV
jgi:hypothetical protein